MAKSMFCCGRETHNRCRIKNHLKGSNRNFIQRRLIFLFDDLKNIIESEEYDTNLRQCLEKASPDYITSIAKRKKDILKEDHGIVVAGETSAGKSTLINKILGMRIFKGRNLESTSTVCKIRNSEKVVIKIESDNGEVEMEDMSDLDVETKQGEKILRDTLKTLTDMTIEKGSRKYESVDIGLPVHFLKGNTIIVDTPGIGGSGKVSQKVMKYLSNAVSFIFVINVASAGGMQRDRLPEILKSIINLQMEDEMPCFDPRSVIFITNKWDSIKRDPDDSSDEDEEEKTWKKVTGSIYRNWPSIREENIFKMNLTDHLKKALEKVVKENENIRIKEHFRYLCTLLEDVYTGVRTRQELTNRSREEQEKKTEEHQTKIDMLKNKCTAKSHFWCQRIKDIIEQKANTSFEYMSSDIGKERILNPKDWLPIMEVTYVPNVLDEEVRDRIDRYIDEKVRSPEVVERFKNIKDDILSFYKEISTEIERLENEWTGTPTVISSDKEEIYKEESIAPYVAGVIATAPIWFPLLAAGFAIAVASAPVVAPIIAYLRSDSRKKKIIDKEYEKSKSLFKSKMCNSMEENHGDALNKLILKITDVLLQRRIKFIEETIKELSENRDKIIANQKSLDSLSEQIKSIKEAAEELKQTLNTSST
ncbi:uncharacterized protein LOC134273763 [Saccostrea cucullata]|uniref:uncharacterized protein LOC134273763 n=1 Tax=Saccostrea cuccullata TaxID=36930 RepID=UPI002ED5AFA4